MYIQFHTITKNVLSRFHVKVIQFSVLSRAQIQSGRAKLQVALDIENDSKLRARAQRFELHTHSTPFSSFLSNPLKQNMIIVKNKSTL